MTESTRRWVRRGVEGLGNCALTNNDLSAFIAALGRPLPSDYLDFLLQTNGVTFKHGSGWRFCFPLSGLWQQEHRAMPDVYPPFRWPPEGDVLGDFVRLPRWLFGASAGSSCLDSPCYGFREVMPEVLVPIGVTASTDVICLGSGGDFGSSVYCWNSLMGGEDSDRELAMEGLSFVANNFLAFWDDIVFLKSDRIVG